MRGAEAQGPSQVVAALTSVNLALRFLLELAGIAALALAGLRLGPGTVLSLALGVAAPITLSS